MRFVLLMCLISTGCATKDYKQLSTQVAENGLQVYETINEKCFIYRDSDSSSLSCIRKDK